MTLVVRPSAALRPFVTAISVTLDDAAAAPDRRERVMPTAGVGILINLREDEFRTYDESGNVSRASGAILSGPQTRVRRIDSNAGASLVCVGLRHGGAAAFVGAGIADMADSMVNMADLFGQNGASLRGRALEARSSSEIAAVVEAVLVKHLRDDARPDRRMDEAAAMLAQGASVREVGTAVGLSSKHLARRFREHVGITPKLFGRIQRLQRVLAGVHGRPDPDWAAVAAGHGYFDQSHMINDFRDLAGVTPRGYTTAATTHQNHVAFFQSERSAAL